MNPTADCKDIAAIVAALGQPGQPEASFDAFARACDRLFRPKLLTILAWRAGSDDAWRVHSSDPANYPTGKPKRMGPTPWGRLVLGEGRSWLGRSAEDLRWAFFDHNLIASLGCESCLAVPVRWNGTSLAAISLLGPAGAYDEDDLARLSSLAAPLAAPLLHVLAAEDPAKPAG